MQSFGFESVWNFLVVTTIVQTYFPGHSLWLSVEMCSLNGAKVETNYVKDHKNRDSKRN